MNESSPHNQQGGSVRFFLKLIRGFESLTVLALILLMMVVVGLSALELGVIIFKEITEPPMLLNLSELLDVLGFFMMVLIGLELLETIKNYLTQHALHVEVVLLVAMIAVARKVIILDMKEISAHAMIGTAVLLISLSASYYLIKKAMDVRPPPPSL